MGSMAFNLISSFKPSGDQPRAIDQLTDTIEKGRRFQTLLGVTGSGKTFTMANVIARLNRPALVISHNKTLAAQLYGEFRDFFPENRVRYFVSYYDYYQPEAYIPATDTYIEKDASINEDLDRLRLATTASILSARDVIVVASVSCIYPIGSPEDHRAMMLHLEKGAKTGRQALLRRLVEIQYERGEFELTRGTFRVRGNTIEVIASYEEIGTRITLSGDEVAGLERFDPLTGKKLSALTNADIFPAKHFVTPREKLDRAITSIREELAERCAFFREQKKPLEEERIQTRTDNDLEMLQQLGYCNGIENYSRHLAGRPPGGRPEALLDYFPKDYLVFIDESHVTLPQIRGMYFGDRSRKQTLVDFGFRLPSALDNRPLQAEEFWSLAGQAVFVSATPGKFEQENCGINRIGQPSPLVAEQIIRPTGLVDPPITILPSANQIDDLMHRIRETVARKQRALVITISKHLAEEIADYLKEYKMKVHYLHYEIDTLERVEILKNLREAKFDVLVGINLLREGLDLPEVSLVAILDADKEGFLRSATSLIQIAGRAARSLDGRVVMYADKITDAMRTAMEETGRRRQIQTTYNQVHNITPQSISKPIQQTLGEILGIHNKREHLAIREQEENFYGKDLAQTLRLLEKKMATAAKQLDFETAIHYRDKIKRIKAEK